MKKPYIVFANCGIDLEWNTNRYIHVRFDTQTIGVWRTAVIKNYTNYIKISAFIKLLKLNGVDYKKNLDKLIKV